MSSIQHGDLKASYFWDDGSGINGDTGAPASGEPMQEGLFASPSWPLGTEGYVEYNGKKADFFIGDRGPGNPAGDCDVLLDMDGKTFAKLTGQTFNESDYTVSGGEGHLNVTYHITKWGDGDGNEGAPHPMGQPDNRCEGAVAKGPSEEEKKEAAAAEKKKADADAAKQAIAENRDDNAAQATQSRMQAQENSLDAGAAGAARESGGTEQATGISAAQSIAHMANDVPAGGGLTLLLVPALAGAALVAKRKSMPVRVAGRHRKPTLLTRMAVRPTAA